VNLSNIDSLPRVICRIQEVIDGWQCAASLLRLWRCIRRRVTPLAAAAAATV